VVVGRDVEGLHHVSFAGQNAVGRGTIFAGDVNVGHATTIGANCYLNGPASLGNYCQLGPSVAIFGTDHSTSYLTTYVNVKLLDGLLRNNRHEATARVGHDVWIGHGAVLLKGVEVGHGAIIGASAVVTGSVPPYAIVVGNPARLLRMRFPDRVMELMLQLEWWLMKPAELLTIRQLFTVDYNRETDRGIELLSEALRSRPGCADPSE